jgi:CheY-like chemotaxis protein
MINGTILLAEDDEDDVLITQIAFKKARLANPLQVVRDGAEAIRYLEGSGVYANRTRFPFPMLLLLDLDMPKLDGFEVLEWLQLHPKIGPLWVAIVSDSAHDPFVDRAYSLGAQTYLIKPPTAENIIALVQRLEANWMILNNREDFQALSV